MKQKLLTIKSLLVAALLGVGTNAWADPTSLYERGTTNVWSDADLTDWVAGGSYGESVTASIDDGLVMTSEAKAKTDYSFTKSVTTGDDTQLVLTATWTPICYGSGNYSYLQFGDIILKASRSDWTSSITANGVQTALTATDNASLTGSWAITLTINQKAHTLTYSITHSKGTDAATVSVAEDADYSSIIAGVHGSAAQWSWAYAQKISAIELTEEAITTSYEDVTLKYEDTDGNSLSAYKADRVVKAEAGTSIASLITSTYTADFYNGSIKYVYNDEYVVTGDYTEVQAGGNTVTLKFKKWTPVNSITVNYKYNDVTIVSEAGTTSGLYVGQTVDISFRMFVEKDGALYQTANNSTDPYYGESTTLTSDVVINKNVSLYNLNGGVLAHFVDLDGSTGNNAGIRASYMGGYDNASYTSTEDIPVGVYTFVMRAYSRGRNSVIKVGDTQLFAITDIVGGSWSTGTKNDVVVSEAGKLMLAKGEGGSSIDPVDVIVAICRSVPVTVSSAGYATYVNSDYDLDFSSSEIEAYKIKVSTKGVATLTKVDNVPAGTPVLLYKDGGATENIPVMTGAAALSGNDLVVGTGAAVATIDGEYTNMILNNGTSGVGFYFANSQIVANNRAYLHIDTSLAPDAVGGSRMVMVFGNEATGIEDSVKSEELKVKSELYNLKGQRVSQPTKGLYIVNGKKVVIK